MHKRRFLFLIIVTIAFASPIFIGWRYLHEPLSITVKQAEFNVPKGCTARQVAHRLHTLHILQHPKWWLLYARLTGAASHIESGDYALRNTMNSLQLLDDLSHGHTIQFSVTIVDGWTFNKVMQMLNKDPHIEHTVKPTDYRDLIHQLGGPKGMPPQGWFYPNTYFFNNGSTDKSILHRAYTAMRHHLDQAWEHRENNLPLKKPYAALILASIVQKESHSPRGRPMVASVFINRLRLGMKLQSDPTVIYGLQSKGQYQGKLTFKDLKFNSPYNTYIHAGLPPTPISIPGMAAINAVVQPDQTQYLYFVATGKGSHVFSKTYAEQKKEVTKYQLGGNATHHQDGQVHNGDVAKGSDAGNKD